MDKKYQIFISSTYKDLIKPRAKVRDAILSMYHFPVGMELFGAADEEQWQIIKETIDSSDYYVLIIGSRYGSVITMGEDAGISYTEKEFQYALKSKIPVLAFILDKNALVKSEYIEKDNPQKLDDFIEKVTTGRQVEWWVSADDLATKVTTSLYKEIARIKRPGWIRGDSVDIEKSLQTIVDLTETVQSLEKENKKLLLENENLRRADSRKPQLSVALGADIPMEDEESHLFDRKDCLSTDENKCVHLKVDTSINTEDIVLEYPHLSRKDLISQYSQYITEEDIRKYNDALPSREEMQKYLEEYKEYHLIQDCGIAVVLLIYNDGTAKATDVSVSIEFPPEIDVYDIEEIYDMKEPEAPKLPRNLNEVAYERANQAEQAMENAYMRFNQFNSLFTPNPLMSSISNFEPNFSTESIEVFDNIVEVEFKEGIMHTKSDWFRGIYLVPREKGIFSAKVTLMCAEYMEEEEIEITLICE